MTIERDPVAAMRDDLREDHAAEAQGRHPRAFVEARAGAVR